jgi:hypothetical protein
MSSPAAPSTRDYKRVGLQQDAADSSSVQNGKSSSDGGADDFSRATDESFATADDGLGGVGDDDRQDDGRAAGGGDRGSSGLSPLPPVMLDDHSFSFDFDDDDEEDLQRYRFDTEPKMPLSKYEQETPVHALAWLPFLWRVYCETRLERRQQRTQKLLNMHTKRERLSLWVSSWCDLYDRGWSVWLIIVIFWILLCRYYRSERKLLLGLGIPLLLLRFAWQPLCLYFRRSRRQKPSSWDPIAQSDAMMVNDEIGGLEEWDARPAYRDREEPTTVELTSTSNNGGRLSSETGEMSSERLQVV